MKTNVFFKSETTNVNISSWYLTLIVLKGQNLIVTTSLSPHEQWLELMLTKVPYLRRSGFGVIVLFMHYFTPLLPMRNRSGKEGQGGQMAYGLVLEPLVIFVAGLRRSKACMTRTMPLAVWILHIVWQWGWSGAKP